MAKAGFGKGSSLAEGPWSLTDHGKKAEKKVKENPYDLESWSVLVREAQTTAIVRARMLYERLVTQFPTSARYWRLYIEQEMRHRNYEQVEKLFQRCLMNILNIDLWRCYIAYVRETKALLPTFREKMRQTHEFALEHVGIDFHSSTIWLDYVHFLQSEEAHGTFAENQKCHAIRKAYQQAIVTPMINIEQLWKEYNNFEQSVNKTTAKKNVESVSRQYVNAKRSTVEYENITRGLLRGGTSTPLQGTPQEAQQLLIWKRYIAWEKSNPTRTEDQALMVKRVLYAYEQCLLCFGHCADIWYEAALYLQRASEAGDVQLSERWAEEAAIMFERATSGLLKNSMLLHFAYADFEESRLKFDKAEAVYSKLEELKDLDPTLVYIQHMKFARRTEGVKSARNIFRKAREDSRIGYHVFVAAALMEYYISKDKTVAFKIFELGLKRFGDDPNYVLAYVDHLAHLNEDNNTRVLFEKVLSTMSTEKTSKIWEKFVEFEAGVGDLASLLKVERRRAATIKPEEGRSRDTVMLVDRYKYFDLMPCSSVELKLMGHPASQQTSQGGGSCTSQSQRGGGGGGGGGGGRGGGSSSRRVDLRETAIVKPDTKQMKPFRPSSTSGVGMNAVPGGAFPIPSACAHVLAKLPPPRCFQGPFVKLNELMHIIETSTLPENFAPDQPLEMKPLKRKRGVGGEESDEDTNGIAPPINDIYRARQQKRVHTTS